MSNLSIRLFLGLALAAAVLSPAHVTRSARVASEPARWPGRDAVATLDAPHAFGGNLSGLAYQAGTPAVLWAVRNGPSSLHKLIAHGASWTQASAAALRYVDGRGEPDAEAITLAERDAPFVYVASERDSALPAVSRMSVLRYDTRAAGAELVATHEWELTGDLPSAEANVGFEAIAFYPDALLIARSFVDPNTGSAYDPARYPNHAGGLFFLGVEGDGMIYVYALNHADGSFARVASFSSGQAAVMELVLDRESGYLWAQCDDTCANRVGVLDIDAHGRFRVRERFERPSGMANLNNEGMAIAADSSCQAGEKPIFWSDDSETEGHSLRAGSVPCGRFF